MQHKLALVKFKTITNTSPTSLMLTTSSNLVTTGMWEMKVATIWASTCALCTYVLIFRDTFQVDMIASTIQLFFRFNPCTYMRAKTKQMC